MHQDPQREEILQAEAAIRRLAAEIAQHATATQQAQTSQDALQQALQDLGESKKDFASQAKKATDALRRRVDELATKADGASVRLEACAEREEQQLAQLHQAVQGLEEVARDIEAAAPRLSAISELIDSALAAQLGAIEDARADVLSDLAALSARLDKREREEQAFRATIQDQMDRLGQQVGRIRPTQMIGLILLAVSLLLNAVLVGGGIYWWLRFGG